MTFCKTPFDRFVTIQIRQARYNVILTRVRMTIADVEKQKGLNIVNVCL